MNDGDEPDADNEPKADCMREDLRFTLIINKWTILANDDGPGSQVHKFSIFRLTFDSSD